MEDMFFPSRRRAYVGSTVSFLCKTRQPPTIYFHNAYHKLSPQNVEVLFYTWSLYIVRIYEIDWINHGLYSCYGSYPKEGRMTLFSDHVLLIVL